VQQATYPALLHWKAVPRPQPLRLEGHYAVLEPLDADLHTPALWRAVRGHDEVWTWLSEGPYPSEDALHQSLVQKQSASGAVFLAVLPEGGPAAGYASSMQRTRAATEAMYLMARHIFDDLGYRRYEWKCNARNEPSRRAAQRLGFTLEGIFRQHMVIKDQNRDTAWYALLDSEWPERKHAFQTWLHPANFDSAGNQKRKLN
jgi:RimJ/RimL family protein N-acetyltransferase